MAKAKVAKVVKRRAKPAVKKVAAPKKPAASARAAGVGRPAEVAPVVEVVEKVVPRLRVSPEGVVLNRRFQVNAEGVVTKVLED